MALQWSTSAQVSTSSGVKVLCHAESGTGKTVLCATAPKPAIISAESGLLSVSKRNLERLFGVGNPSICYDIPVLEVKTYSQFLEAYNYFAVPSNRASDYFKTICIDSVTEIGEVILSAAKVGNKDPRQAYGELAEKVQELVKKFRDLSGFHIYMAAKQGPFDMGNGVTKLGPSMPGKQAGPGLPYMFDEVFRLGKAKTDTGAEYRFLQTDLDMQYVAKDRSGMLAPVEEPHLTKIFNKIQGVTA